MFNILCKDGLHSGAIKQSVEVLSNLPAVLIFSVYKMEHWNILVGYNMYLHPIAQYTSCRCILVDMVFMCMCVYRCVVM